MKKILLMLLTITTINAVAQIPRTKRPAKNDLPIPNVQPADAIKPDLTITINQVESITLDTVQNNYVLKINITITNNSDIAIDKNPIVALYLKNPKLGSTEFHRTDFWNSIPELAANENHTNTYYFKIKNYPNIKSNKRNIKLVIDDTRKITEANENNNESAIETITVDPAIKFPPDYYGIAH